MTLSPILNASIAVQIHVVAVLIAITATIFIFTRAKGTGQHRIGGYIWVASMAVTALSTFWIHGLNTFTGFSIIHLISVFVLVELVRGLRHIRRGKVSAHRKTMTGMVWGGLVVAGGLSFLPGRVMYTVLVGG